MRLSKLSPLVLALVFTPACGDSAPTETDPDGPGLFGTNDVFDVPILGLTRQEVDTFNDGDALFDLALREYDGLGPLYTRSSCSACHNEAARGPGLVQKMVVVDSDGVTPAADQSKLPFGHTVHPLVTSQAMTPILAPLADATVKVTTRIGPPVLGRGYMEAVADSEIERVAAAQVARTDGIHGRINHALYTSQPNPDGRVHNHQPGDRVIGRFGLKARIPTLDDFTADAAQGDMGITSPLRPTEFANPDQLTDDLKPGTDITVDSINKRADYLRTIAIPRRYSSDQGSRLFDQASCSACHVPTMKTRADYPVKVLAGIDAPIYTDMLVHDMGPALADGIVEFEATGRDWRTAPLIGLRFNKAFLHDGRARSIEEAIRMHAGAGSEANGSVGQFDALSAKDRQALLDFVGSL